MNRCPKCGYGVRPFDRMTNDEAANLGQWITRWADRHGFDGRTLPSPEIQRLVFLHAATTMAEAPDRARETGDSDWPERCSKEVP